MESHWSREFYRAATSLVPKSRVISSHFRELGGAAAPSKDALEYYVAGDEPWLIRFLVGNRNSDDIMKLFEDDGIKKTLPIKEEIVVDFQWKKKKPIQKQFEATMMRVTVAEDFNSAIIDYKGQETEIGLIGNQLKTLEDVVSRPYLNLRIMCQGVSRFQGVLAFR